MFEDKLLKNRRDEKLAGYYWLPQEGKPIDCLLFMSHGFSEHLGLYDEISEYLGDKNILVFGHDHIGHGNSDGKRAYVENVDDFCDDVALHVQIVKEQYPNKKCFILGHSMGGMVAIRTVLRHKNLFDGMILNGPLIIPGPEMKWFDLRPTPFRTFVCRAALRFFCLFFPEMEIGKPHLPRITRDEVMQVALKNDQLRWTGGCKLKLLSAFVDCLDDNMNQLPSVNIPFMIIHGGEDVLCNKHGSYLLYRWSMSTDKQYRVFPGAMHQLFFEYKSIRDESFKDIATWIKQRL